MLHAQVSSELELPGFQNGNISGALLPGDTIVSSSPVVAEIDGNPGNGKEIAVAGKDSLLHVLRADGSLLWTRALPNAGCAKGRGSERTISSPAVGELFGDGVPYVVIGYGRIGTDCKGGVIAFRGYDGQKRWNFNVRKFGKRQGYKERYQSVLSTPALADVNNDGLLEVGFGSIDRHVYLLNARGKAIWSYQAADTVWSSPSFAQADGVGNLEMIIGTDISKNERLKPPTHDGGYVYALRTKPLRDARRKRKQKLYRFRDPKIVLWQTALDQVIFSTPVVAELVPDNEGEEIVVGSGCYFPSSSNNKRGKWFKVLSLRTGEVLRTLNTTACSPSTAGVADIDEDGFLDIVASVHGSKQVGGDGTSRLMAWSGLTGALLWEIEPQDAGRTDSFQAQFQSPIIADIDGNGSLEVLLATSRSIGIYNGKDGTPLHCYLSSCEDTRVHLRTGAGLKASPAIADINGDGELEVIMGSGRSGTGTVHAWSLLRDYLESDEGTFEPYAVPWGMFRGSASRQGR